MTLLSRYIARHILTPYAVGTFILLLALSLERLLRMIEDLAPYDVAPGQIIGLLIYLVPHYLGLALPAALFMGIIIGLRNLNDHSEIVVMRAAGLTQTDLLNPILLCALLSAILLLALVWWGQPYSRYQYQQTLHELKTQAGPGQLVPGQFKTSGDDIVLRAEHIDEQTGELTGFFGARMTAAGNQTFITAETAVISEIQKNGRRVIELDLKNGRMVKTTAAGAGDNNRALPLTFDRYQWTPDILAQTPYGLRGDDERELTLDELARGGRPHVTVKSTQPELAAEFHARLVPAASLPFLALLAVPLAFMGRGRTGKASGIITGIIILVSYEKALGLAENLAETGPLDLVPFYIWGVYCGLLLAACVGYSASADHIKYALKNGIGLVSGQRGA